MSKPRGIAIPLFECVFQGTSWTSTSLYAPLAADVMQPGGGQYIVCIADNNIRPRSITGALGIQTTYNPAQQEFFDAVITLIGQSEKLSALWGAKISLLPTKLSESDSRTHLCEREWTHVAMNERLKFATADLRRRSGDAGNTVPIDLGF